MYTEFIKHVSALARWFEASGRKGWTVEPEDGPDDRPGLYDCSGGRSLFVTAKTARAQVHEGRLELLEPLALPEGAQVLLSIARLGPGDDGEKLREAVGQWNRLVPEELAEDLML